MSANSFLLIIVFVFITFVFSFAPAYSKEIKSCECVVFRIDDLQDYWISDAQKSLMNLFLSKNQSVTLGLIMNAIGNDTELVDKIREGSSKGHFELALHGWDHIDYTNLTLRQQIDTLHRANEKMQSLFGNRSDIFIPPFNTFNNNTLKAMNDQNLKVLESSVSEESNFNQNQSIFNAYQKDAFIENSTKRIYHLPLIASYDEYVNGTLTKPPLSQVLGNIMEGIDKYGYAVITLHPQDFVNLNEDGELADTLNFTELHQLSMLIDSIKGKNISITSLSGIVDLSNPYTQSTKSSEMARVAGRNCSEGWHITGYFTPLENDYLMNNDSKRERIMAKDVITGGVQERLVLKSFLDDVLVEGWGKTLDGDYLGWNFDYHFWYTSKSPKDALDNNLSIGMVATDPEFIPLGSRIIIPTLPAPWDKIEFIASDIGPSIIGKHIDLFVGEGKYAKFEMYRITSENQKVCIS